MSIPKDSVIRLKILELVTERGLDKTICPTEAAQSVAADAGAPDDWRQHLKPVRRVAAKLARKGRIQIYRKGKPIMPEDMKGVVRLGLLPGGELVAETDGKDDEEP